jgi:hypothetical protein
MSQLEMALDAPSPDGLVDLGGSWDQAVGRAVEAMLLPGGASQVVPLSSKRAWALLSWVEGMATLIARVRDVDVLGRAIFASLWVGASNVIDLRETLLVCGLLRRGADVADLDFIEEVRRVEEVVGPHDLFPLIRGVSAKLPPNYDEVPVMGGVEFRRKRSRVDVDDLTERFGE